MLALRAAQLRAEAQAKGLPSDVVRRAAGDAEAGRPERAGDWAPPATAGGAQRGMGVAEHSGLPQRQALRPSSAG